MVGGGWWPFRTGRTTTLMLDGEDVPSIVNPTACVAWVERSCTLSLRGAPHTHKVCTGQPPRPLAHSIIFVRPGCLSSAAKDAQQRAWSLGGWTRAPKSIRLG